MTARVVTHANAHTFGVMDAAMAERRDTKFLQSSLSAAENVIVLPQGGYVDRGGSTHICRTRRSLDLVTVTEGMLDNPNGGTRANLLDNDTATLFTTASVNSDPFVVMLLTFVAPAAVAAIDLLDFKADVSADSVLEVQYNDGAGWQTFGSPVNIRTTARRRRFAVAPDDGNQTATDWRVVITGGPGPGAISLSELNVWTETDTASKPRSQIFNRTVDERFDFIFTDNNLDIYRDGIHKAAVPVPVTQDMLHLLKPQKKDDSLLLFHHDLRPQQILWQGGDAEWNVTPITFENFPRYDFGDTIYTNGVTEKQQIQLFALNDGEKFELEIEGEKTEAITKSGTDAITAANIKAALEDLTLIDAGLTVTVKSQLVFNVEFTGGDNVDRDWLQMSGLALDQDGFVSTRTITKGKPGGEDPFSATRGWPAAGRFAFGRLVLVGFKSLLSHYLASVTSDPFNLNVELGGAAAAIFLQIDDDDLSAIHDVRVSRTLTFFTDS
ncbi:MAG: hypothetical protein OER56_11325, partial [Hyphomicrobiales bacterium]|nr:hypothetical protein [Hyphomicrobiales bacterium]